MITNGTLIRPANTDTVFWVDESQARYIVNSDVLNGVFDGEILELDIPTRGPDVVDGTLLVNVGGAIYLIDRYKGGNFVQRSIPNMDVFRAMSFKQGPNIANWSQSQLDGYGVGPAFH
jgi:hypothetical protein